MRLDAICLGYGHRPTAWRGWSPEDRAAALAIDNVRLALAPERRRPILGDEPARVESHELQRILSLPISRADLTGFGLDVFGDGKKRAPPTSPADLMAIFPDMTPAEAAEWAGAGGR